MVPTNSRTKPMALSQYFRDAPFLPCFLKVSDGAGESKVITLFPPIQIRDYFRKGRTDAFLKYFNRAQYIYSGGKKYLVSHQLCNFSHLKR
jgi:hypothetical protein